MNLINRQLAQEIVAMSKSYPIVTLLGPRQSGKTTLVKMLFPEKPYISLEDLDVRSFAKSDPRGFLQQFPEGAIFDEIQRLPELLSYLQGIVDLSEKKGLFILTGSHQLALHEAVSQSLAGRTALLKLLPFDLKELENIGIEHSLDKYIFYGMYPRIYKDNIPPTKFYRDYIQTYVERDVRQMLNIKDLGLFQQFLKLVAGRIGQVFNSNNLANELGVSYHTIANWLSILEASFLIFRLPPYFENLGKRIIKSPKIYFTDTGLACYLLDINSVDQVARDPLRGQLVENFVISEFIKNRINQGIEPNFYFYRDSNQKEIDLLYKIGSLIIPIEIKASLTFTPHFLNNLYYLQKLTQNRSPRGAIIYAGTHEQEIGPFKVFNFKHIASAIHWLDEARLS